MPRVSDRVPDQHMASQQARVPDQQVASQQSRVPQHVASPDTRPRSARGVTGHAYTSAERRDFGVLARLVFKLVFKCVLQVLCVCTKVRSLVRQ